MEPAGIVMPFAGSTAPQGYLLCDGSAVSRSDYADLFAVIGVTYGSGDGATTFNVPDLSGRVVLGVSQSHALGTTGGEATHILTEQELPAHSHVVPSHAHTNDISAKTPVLKHNITAQPAFSYSKPVAKNTRTDYSQTAFNSTNDVTATAVWLSISAHDNVSCTVSGGAGASNPADSSLVGGGSSHNNMQPYVATSYIISTGV
jgi:microcystin-dependent protein